MSNVHIIIKNYIFYIINIIMVKIKMVLSFLGPKGVLFYEIIGGHSMPPRQLTYIFDPAGNRVNNDKMTLSSS